MPSPENQNLKSDEVWRKGWLPVFILAVGYVVAEEGFMLNTLYDIGHDPGERFDVAASHPDLLADIAKEVERHRRTITQVKCQLEEVVAEKR